MEGNRCLYNIGTVRIKSRHLVTLKKADPQAIYPEVLYLPASIYKLQFELVLVYMQALPGVLLLSKYYNLSEFA